MAKKRKQARPKSADPCQAAIDELNDAIRTGELKVLRSHPIYGVQEAGLADGSASVHRMHYGPSTGSCAGALFHYVSGWDLVAGGRTVLSIKRHVTDTDHNDYERVVRWLQLKLRNFRARSEAEVNV